MNRLRQAAQAGDIYELYNALLKEEEEEDVLSRIDQAELVETPLHIAASRGHDDFAKAMIYLKPSWGRKLDRNICSPMQLALQNGHRQVVLDLLAVDKDLVRVKGRGGYTALHYAAENGDIDILAQFLKYCPACVDDMTIRNETALHLAVKNNKLEAVEILARFLRRTHLYCKVSKSHLLNSKDRNGNTALHIAACNNHPQMIKVLTECRVDTKVINNQGSTALNLLRDMQSSETENREICLKIFISIDQLYSKRRGMSEMGKDAIVFLKIAFSKQKKEVEPALSERLRSKITNQEEEAMLLTFIKMSTEKINALLVVVTLILTSSYQAFLSPPGGVWQGEYAANNRVGQSVMDTDSFAFFSALNVVMFLYTSCLTFIILHAVTKRRAIIFLFELLFTSIACSVHIGLMVINPKDPDALVKPRSVISKISDVLSFFMYFLLFEFFRKLYASPTISFFLEFFDQDM